MANRDAAFGLRPLRRFDGAAWTGATQKCLIEDDYSSDLFVGDPVIFTGAAGSDDSTGHYNIINIATSAASNRISGVIASFEPNRDNLSRNYHATDTAGYANVITDPFVVFAIQDNAEATLTSNHVGGNADLVSGTGSKVTGLSGWELDAGTVGADNTYQCMIVGVHNVVNNDVGDWVIWEVILSQHTYLAVGGNDNDGAYLGVNS